MANTLVSASRWWEPRRSERTVALSRTGTDLISARCPRSTRWEPCEDPIGCLAPPRGVAGASRRAHVGGSASRDRAAPPGPQWPACGRGRWGRCLPPRLLLGFGGISRGRPVLRPLGIPHHLLAPRGMGAHGRPQFRGVLGTAGASAAPRPLPGRRRARSLSLSKRPIRWTRRQRLGGPIWASRRRTGHVVLRR